jgi:hypothetical protein
MSRRAPSTEPTAATATTSSSRAAAADVVRCGAGRDTVVRDGRDRVAADREVVRRG